MLDTGSLASWMIYTICLGALVTGVAAAAEESFRRAGLPVRALWGGAMLITLLLPLIAVGPRFARNGSSGSVPGFDSVTAFPAAVPQRPPVPAVASPPRIRPAAPAPAADPPSSVPPDAVVVAPRMSLLNAFPIPDLSPLDDPALRIATWAPLVCVAWLLLAWMNLRSRRREWRDDMVDGASVLVSRAFGPAIVGVARPRIVIPAWAAELPESERELMLAHERAHVSAHDGRALALALAALTITPWNLALWYQLRRFRLAVELDCDARVLGAVGDVKRYGDLLLDVAQRAPNGSAMITALVERRSALRRRIEAMTTPRGRTPTRRLVRDGSIIAFVALVGCLIAAPGAEGGWSDSSSYETDTFSDADTSAVSYHAGTQTDTASWIPRDSAHALLGDSLFTRLERLVNGHPLGATVQVSDWDQPPHIVSAVRGNVGVIKGALTTNGTVVGYTFTQAISSQQLRTIMSIIHMSANARYYVDSIPTTPAVARALIDAGRVHGVTFVMAASGEFRDSLPTPYGAIRLSTVPTASFRH